MANIFLRSSDGSDADSGADWANAKATLTGAFAAMAAGDTCYVSDNHAETTAGAITLTSPGTAASPCRVLCVDDAGDPVNPTTLATTATISSTGANAINYGPGIAYVYGITFQAGSAGNAANLVFNTQTGCWIMDTCGLKLNNTNTGSGMQFGSSSASTSSLLRLLNCTLVYGSTSQFTRWQGPFEMFGGSVALTGSVPTTWMLGQAANPTLDHVRLVGVDLSAFGSGKTLFNVGTGCTRVDLENCKLGASVTLTTGTPTSQGGWRIRLDNCDSSSTNYKMTRHFYEGDVTQDISIFRTGGASDGTTPLSWKMVSSANSKFYAPLTSPTMIAWLDTTGSKTVTVEVITDNVTLTDAEAWVEVEYLGTSGFPLSVLTSDRATNVLTTGTNQTTSTVGWTTGALGTPVKQKLSINFTTQLKGLVRVRVLLAKASTTMYVDPLITVS